ncbi:MAG: glycoside hydrolase [Acidobacteria bacterium]|nr:glycoside hydrolase [Acidobacteriota bacterium]
MKIPILFAILMGGAFSLGALIDRGIADRKELFLNPPEDCRILMRWWWFGPSVNKAELEREMKLMKNGGIGGFEVQPVYPLALDDPVTGIENLPFLSEEFLDALRFASDKARELGLRMDLTLGSGWPFGGPQVPVRDAAGRLRIERLPVPDGARSLALPHTSTGERFLAAFLCAVRGKQIAAEGIRELADIRDGSLTIPEGLEGPHEAVVFIAGRSGMMVKRAALGAEGFVLNHYDRAAVERYLENVGDRLMQALRPNPPYAIFCDSLEVYQSDWTDGFPEEFRRRRGYDLTPHLPALAFDLGDRTAAIRCDWGRTLTELFHDHFMKPVHAWSRRNGTLFRVQGYGIPPATVSSNADADISEGEGVQHRAVSATRWASSANHLFGRTVTSSETWTWLHSPAFRATPLDMKAEANLHFLQGVNQLIGHGWPYSPETVDTPGWRFYAAGVFSNTNPWWIVMPDVALYLQRSSWMLRQGVPVNDIAFYLPVSDAYAGFSPGQANLIESLRTRVGPDAVGAVLDAGFNLDFFDDDALLGIGGINNGTLLLGENRYRAVVLPHVERIPTDSYRMLADFVRSGGTLIATGRQPALAPGFAATESDHEEIRSISRKLFFSPSENARFVADEKTDLAAALRDALPPDVLLPPENSEIGFVHRKTGDADIYFLANDSNVRQKTRASFRVTAMRAEWWDPMSGQTLPAEFSTDGRERTHAAIDLEPYEGRFLVFTGQGDPEPAAPKGAVTASLDLSRNWRVAFGPGAPPKTMERLSSWIEDDATRYFSGAASYEKIASIPENMLNPDTRLILDLGKGTALPRIPSRSNGMRAWFEGPVREAAVVSINGRRAGAAWCPPYEVEVTGLLKNEDNSIVITVANTAVNYMAGRPLPDYRLLNQRYGKRFDPQDMDKIQPVDSGLFGPIRLIAIQK